METKTETKCWVCGIESDNGNLCQTCEENGWWIDPVGGLHDPNEEPEDYASDYE
jgi:hypothetical protein